MVLVNYTTRELTAKLVYYGPGLCGKTTNLEYVYENLLPEDRRGQMVSLATETDRTLFFDFLPLDLGTIRGLKTKLQLYTVPGQVHYNATRKIVLKGADGIVFVADSQRSQRDNNIESYRNMKANLAEHGVDLADIPLVLQFNKRDLPDIMPVEEMEEDLNEYNAPFWESVATEGIGVEDTLKSVARLVLKKLAKRFQPDAVKEEEAAGAAPATEAPKTKPAAEEPAAAQPQAPSPGAQEPEPAAAEPEPAAAGEKGSPMLAHTGELLSLDFGPGQQAEAKGGSEDEGGGGDATDDASDEVLDVGEDAVLLDEEPGTAEGSAASAEPASVASSAAAEEDPFGADDDASSGPASSSADDPFGADEDEPSAPSPPAAGAEEDLFADEAEAPAAAAGGESDADDLEAQARDLSGDTMLSSPDELEGLATEADLPGAATPSEAPASDAEAPAKVSVAAISLGRVESGAAVERTLDVPVEYEDASGTKRVRRLEVRLSFRLDD